MLSASRVLFGILAPKSKSVSDETKKKGLKDRSRSTSKDQRKSDGLQPPSNGLQPTSDGLQLTRDAVEHIFLSLLLCASQVSTVLWILLVLFILAVLTFVWVPSECKQELFGVETKSYPTRQ